VYWSTAAHQRHACAKSAMLRRACCANTDAEMLCASAMIGLEQQQAFKGGAASASLFSAGAALLRQTMLLRRIAAGPVLLGRSAALFSFIAFGPRYNSRAAGMALAFQWQFSDWMNARRWLTPNGESISLRVRSCGEAEGAVC